MRQRCLDLFAAMDSDGNGTLSRDEIAAAHGGDEGGYLSTLPCGDAGVSADGFVQWCDELVQSKGRASAEFFLTYLEQNMMVCVCTDTCMCALLCACMRSRLHVRRAHT